MFHKILLFSSLIFMMKISAREVVLITHNLTGEKLATVKKVLDQRMNIPEILITLRYERRPCEQKEKSIIQLCLTKDDDVKIIQFDNKIANKSLGIFLQDSMLGDMQ